MQSARRESGDHKGQELGRARRAGRCKLGWQSDLQWRSSLRFAMVSSAYFFSRRCNSRGPQTGLGLEGLFRRKAAGWTCVSSEARSECAVIASRAHSDQGKALIARPGLARPELRGFS